MKHQIKHAVFTLLLIILICPLFSQTNSFSAAQVKILSLDKWVNDIEISPFGKFIAVAGRDNDIQIFDTNYKQLFIFRGNNDYANVNVFGFTHDEKYLVFMKNESEKDLGLIDLEKLEDPVSLSGHREKIYCFTISQDGRFAASGGYNGELIIWERIPEGFRIFQKIVIAEHNIRKLVFSRDSGFLSVVLHNDTIDLYKYQNSQFEHHQILVPTQHYGNTGYLYGLSFSPDSKTLVCGLRNELTVWEFDGSVYNVIQVIPDIGNSYIQCLEFTPNGEMFACGFGRGEIQFWNNSNSVWTESEILHGAQDYVQDLEFSPDGKILASGSRNSNSVIFRELTGLEPDPVMKLSLTTGIPFSQAQKKIIDSKISLEILSGLDQSLAGAKDEFETQAEYNDRILRLSGQAVRLLQDYTKKSYSVIDESDLDGNAVVKIGVEDLLQYQIEEERYYLRFMNTEGYINIHRNDARTLKQNWTEASILAIEGASSDGVSFVHSKFTLIHPVNELEYELYIDENPFRALPVDETVNRIFEKQIGPYILVKNIVLNDIFPVFYRYYDKNSIGNAEIVNTGAMPIDNLRITLFIQNYMDNPKNCPVSETLGVNKRTGLEFFALLNSKVLDLSEGDILSTKITVEYSVGGKDYSGDIIQSIRLYDRNAVVWDDDRKAAAFVTAKDPVILRYSKRIIGMTDNSYGSAFNKNLLQAISLFEGMRASGLTYIIDPSTPYSDFSKTGSAIDFLQFPRQTLEYGAGDCDDLSILYNALLESVGINTAFITIPGHIFTAFNTGINKSNALRYFSRPEELFFINNEAWIPVETTALETGFLKAWELGLGLYNRFSALDELNFFTTADAWLQYEPVGIDDDAEVLIPSVSEVTENYTKEMIKYREKEIFIQEKQLLSDIAADDDNPALINKLGVLYSRYGMYESALIQFDRILSNNDYLPAIMNKGNVHSILKDFDKALEYFKKAAEKYPDNPRVLLSLTMIYLEKGDLEEAETIYLHLKGLDPELAAKFAVLESPENGNSARASNIGDTSAIFTWEWD